MFPPQESNTTLPEFDLSTLPPPPSYPPPPPSLEEIRLKLKLEFEEIDGICQLHPDRALDILKYIRVVNANVKSELVEDFLSQLSYSDDEVEVAATVAKYLFLGFMISSL